MILYDDIWCTFERQTSVTSKVRAACGEGGKDLENISSAVLEAFSAKKNIVFLIINPRPRLFLRGALLFEYLKHEKACVWFGQDKRVCYIQAFDFARYKTAPANVRRHTVDVDGRQIIGEVIPHSKHSLDALARSMSAIGWFTASWRKGLVFFVEWWKLEWSNVDTNDGSWHFLPFLWNSSKTEKGKFIRRHRPLVPKMRVSGEILAYVPWKDVKQQWWDFLMFTSVICEATKFNWPSVLRRFDHFATRPCCSVQLLRLETVDLMEWVWTPVGEDLASTTVKW